MPPAVLAATMALPAAVALVGWLVLAPRDPARAQVLNNATQGLDAGASEAAGPIGPGLGSKIVRRLTPPGVVARVERQINAAGRPAGWTLGRVLAAKVLMPAIEIVLGMMFIASDPSMSRYLLVAVVTVVSHFVPDLLLYSRGQERQAAIGQALPDTLDQMTIGVEAGLGFEAAMMRSARNGTGPLSEELVRTLNDMQLGSSRRNAYLALADRVNVPDLGKFLRAVIQADAYGIAIADVLRTQASEMRLKRRQRAEEKAMKIPVKVLFPLMVCIMPALFVVLLGPAIIDIVKAFS